MAERRRQAREGLSAVFCPHPVPQPGESPASPEILEGQLSVGALSFSSLFTLWRSRGIRLTVPLRGAKPRSYTVSIPCIMTAGKKARR